MVDWVKILRPDVPLLEIAVRGTVMYLALFTMLRVVLKRESGTTGITDLLVIVLIADAAQNAMADDYSSIADGLLLCGVIMGWSYLLDAVSFRWPLARRLIRPEPLLLVRHGQVMHRNLRRELITEEELRSQLREQGIDDLSRVKEVRMEPDGQFSVITRVGGPPRGSKRSRRQEI